MESTSPKFFCFVLMPFSSDFDDIYKFGIKGSCEDANSYCERVDEQIFQENIMERVYNQIAKADLVIADMSERNPNVFYEVGYAHALNKPTILLTQKANDIPFDLNHLPHIIYDKKISTLRENLTTRIIWFRENAPRKMESIKIGLDIYIDNINISKEEVIHEYEDNQIPNFDFTIHNNS